MNYHQIMVKYNEAENFRRMAKNYERLVDTGIGFIQKENGSIKKYS